MTDRVAIVTGGLRGLGRSMTLGLAANGVRVLAVGHLAEDEAAMRGTPNVRPMIADLRSPEACDRVVAEAISAFGRVDILVNNAGGSRVLPIDAPEERWVEAMTLNFTRPRQLAHALLPGMIENRYGRIINITGKSEPEHLNAAFSAKAGIHAWAKGLSREVGQYGITVNSIPPGRIMSEQIRRNYPEEYRKQFAETEIPVRYWGEPEDLAVMAVWLASPLARYVTGAVIPVDGGLRRYQF
jgi:3-oxoacyl-[acyl-carrier protein] reductase